MRTWREVRIFASQKFRLTPEPGIDSVFFLRTGSVPGVKKFGKSRSRVTFQFRQKQDSAWSFVK